MKLRKGTFTYFVINNQKCTGKIKLHFSIFIFGSHQIMSNSVDLRTVFAFAREFHSKGKDLKKFLYG